MEASLPTQAIYTPGWRETKWSKARLKHGPAELKFEVISSVQPADLTSIRWAPILLPAFLQSFSFFFLQKVLVDRANKLSSMPQPTQRPSKRKLTPHTKSSFVHQKENRKVSKLIYFTYMYSTYYPSLHHYHVSPSQRFDKAIGFSNKWLFKFHQTSSSSSCHRPVQCGWPYQQYKTPANIIIRGSWGHANQFTMIRGWSPLMQTFNLDNVIRSLLMKLLFLPLK